MNTQQFIEKKKKEFKKEFINNHNGFRFLRGIHEEEIDDFLHSFALELIETVSEEIISKNLAEWGQPTEKFRKQLQREIKDEIINSIKK